MANASPKSRAKSVELWQSFELALPGPTDGPTGNPYVDSRLAVRFYQEGRETTVLGFYDGGGIYRVRFMPPKVGLWHYTTLSNRNELEAIEGEFMVVSGAGGGAASAGKDQRQTAADTYGKSHGPVAVAQTFHFEHADGTPFRPLGVAWPATEDARSDALVLRALASSPFRKVRIPIFPSAGGGADYPFDGTPGHVDTTRFNPNFFRRLEHRIRELKKLGVEAEVVLFHKDQDARWGFDKMSPDDDDRYVRYVVARLASFSNIWWSLADGWDSMVAKPEAAIERLGTLVAAEDPSHHLLSVRGAVKVFNPARPWITHVDVVADVEAATPDRKAVRKPIIMAVAANRLGGAARSAEDLVSFAWEQMVSGHYIDFANEPAADGIGALSWSKSGAAKKGPALSRLAFMRRVVQGQGGTGRTTNVNVNVNVNADVAVEPIAAWQGARAGGQTPDRYLVYLGKSHPNSWPFSLPRASSAEAGGGSVPTEGMKFAVEIVDTWNMTMTPIKDAFVLQKADDGYFADQRRRAVTLPGRPYMALRIQRLAR